MSKYRLSLFACFLALNALNANAQRYIDRPEVQLFASEVAARNNMEVGPIMEVLAQAEALPRVIELIRPPTQPGVRSWQRYRARFLDRVRITNGARFLQENREALAAAQARYGVPVEIIVSIIGVETVYGRNTGSFQTLSALATLAFDYPPRADLFRRELESLFVLARDQGRSPLDYRGSYAGALGLPQFLPSSIRNFAVDFDNDGRIDLSNSRTDAIGSVASFLSAHGWQAGGAIAVPAYLAPETDPAPLLAKGLLPQTRPAEFAAAGVHASRGAPDEVAALIDLETPGQATEYWLGYRNFYAITRYNRSSFYAMSVMQLAEAIRQEYELRRQPVSAR